MTYYYLNQHHFEATKKEKLNSALTFHISETDFFSVHKVVLSICEKVHLLFFSVFVGYIFKGASGASVQWIGSLKNKKEVQMKVCTFSYYTVLKYLNNFMVHYQSEEASQS